MFRHSLFHFFGHRIWRMVTFFFSSKLWRKMSNLFSCFRVWASIDVESSSKTYAKRRRKKNFSANVPQHNLLVSLRCKKLFEEWTCVVVHSKGSSDAFALWVNEDNLQLKALNTESLRIIIIVRVSARFCLPFLVKFLYKIFQKQITSGDDSLRIRFKPHNLYKSLSYLSVCYLLNGSNIVNRMIKNWNYIFRLNFTFCLFVKYGWKPFSVLCTILIDVFAKFPWQKFRIYHKPTHQIEHCCRYWVQFQMCSCGI